MAPTQKKANRSSVRSTSTPRSPQASRAAKVDRKVYKSVEVTATSPQDYSDAIRVGVAKARETVRRLSWWEVTDQRGRIDPDTCEIDEFQVTLRIHFEVE
jgi:flavin-binding protein dodecin